MKPDFLDQPYRWTRAPRIDQSPGDYACAVERFDTPHWHDRLVFWASVAAMGALGVVLWTQ